MTGYIHYAALDYQAKTINEIQNIHTYLMKKKQYCINEEQSIFSTIFNIKQF